MRIPFKLLAGVMIICGLHAEEPDSKDGHKIWVIMGSTPEALGADHQLIVDGNAQRLPLTHRKVLGPISVPPTGTIQIAEAEKNLLETPIPKDMKQALVILIPSTNEKGELGFDAVFKDLVRFTAGSWLFLNTSPSQIKVNLADQEVILKEGESQTLKVNSDEPQAVKSLSFESRKDEDEDWSMMSSSTVASNSTRREVCFFTLEPGSGRISYKGMTLILPE